MLVDINQHLLFYLLVKLLGGGPLNCGDPTTKLAMGMLGGSNGLTLVVKRHSDPHGSDPSNPTTIVGSTVWNIKHLILYWVLLLCFIAMWLQPQRNC